MCVLKAAYACVCVCVCVYVCICVCVCVCVCVWVWVWVCVCTYSLFLLSFLRYHDGDFFGQISFFLRRADPTTVRAITFLDMVVLDIDDWADIMRHHKVGSIILFVSLSCVSQAHRALHGVDIKGHHKVGSIITRSLLTFISINTHCTCMHTYTLMPLYYTTPQGRFNIARSFLTFISINTHCTCMHTDTLMPFSPLPVIFI
jgi:hypothetical protein